MIDNELRCGCQHKSSLIKLKSGTTHCTLSTCPYSSGKGFLSCAGKLVLISFDVVDTLCQKERYVNRKEGDFDEYIPRKNNAVLNFARKILHRPSKTTQHNAQSFLNAVFQIRDKPRILIIGSGVRGNGTDALYSCSNCDLTGVDIYPSPTVNYIADAHYLPFANESFDGVWIQAVLEHVANPQMVVNEIHRVLHLQGVVYAETPFMQQVHEAAYDFTRFTVLGHRFLFRYFKMLSCGGKGGPSVVLAWSIRYWLMGLLRNITLAKVLTVPLFIFAPLFDALMSKKILFDASSGTFFLGVKQSTPVSMKSLPELYKGMQA